MHPLWTMNVFLSSFFYFIFMLWFRFICHLRRAPWLSVVHTLSCILNLKRQLTETTARPVGNGMRNEKRENKQSSYMIHCFGFDCMCNNRGVSMCAFDVSVIAACHTTRKFQLFSIKCTILFIVFPLNFKLFMNIEWLKFFAFFYFRMKQKKLESKRRIYSQKELKRRRIKPNE